MTKHVIKLVFISLLVFSCKDSGSDRKSQNTPTTDESDSTTNSSYSYMSDIEVEKLIDSKSNQFLSAFWPGMTETQCLEVLRYLIDKEKCVVQFNNDQGEYQDMPSSEIKSVQLISNKVGYQSSKSYQFLYRLRAENKLIVFDMAFNFGTTDSLWGITLGYADHGNMENLNLHDFEYFIDLYISKYGKPVDKDFKDVPNFLGFKTKDYRRYRFLKNGISVELEYKSLYSEEIETESKLNQIHIYYKEYNVDDKYITYEENHQANKKLLEDLNKMQEKEEKDRLKKEKEESQGSI